MTVDDEGSSARLAVRGATVRFGATAAVEHVDLDVAPGEVIAILGPSGSGKSTLLRAIAGLQRMDAGRVLLDGRDLAGLPAHRRGIGLMFQDQALFPHHDVAANVAFGLRMQGLGRTAIRSRVADLLAMVGLAGMGERVVQSLSGGEQQRVALARSLAPEPRVLLLDEPLGALDRALRERLVGELRLLFTELGVTVVAVTHDQAEAFALADRLVVMNAGQVLRSGTPSEIWSDPQRVQVAEMLGFSNIIDADVERGVARTAFGPLPVGSAIPDGQARLIVRPAGVRLHEAGALPALVASSTFRGTITSLRLRIDGLPTGLDVDVPTALAPHVGEPVRFDIDPAHVTPLAP